MSPRTLTGRAILELMADGQRRLTREIGAAIGVVGEIAGERAKTLAKRGFLERAVVDGMGIYHITDAGRAFLESNQPQCGPGKGGCAARHRTSLRARAWNVMRMRDWWSLNDLLMTVADGSEADAESNLKFYVQALSRAGYLTRSRRDGLRWHLSYNTGRMAPALNKSTGTLADPNTGEIFDVRYARH